MGCGKTTLGRAVARAASLRFIDLDEYIEQKTGMTVRRYFEVHGEPSFRQAERDALAEVSSLSDVIVACGGGTPCQPGLMDMMLRSGTAVWLETPIDVLTRRLAEGRSTRPLIASLTDDQLPAFIASRLADRSPHYSRATERFDSSRLESVEQIAVSVDLFIKRFINNR